MVILYLVLFLGFIALVALGMSFLLLVTKPEVSLAKRSVISGFVAGTLPTIPGLFALFGSGAEGVELWLPVIALVIGALTFSLLVGFPVAHLFAKKRMEASGERVGE